LIGEQQDRARTGQQRDRQRKDRDIFSEPSAVGCSRELAGRADGRTASARAATKSKIPPLIANAWTVTPRYDNSERPHRRKTRLRQRQQSRLA
jgi:hypothetical protein